jgi:hypothetical protein
MCGPHIGVVIVQTTPKEPPKPIREKRSLESAGFMYALQVGEHIKIGWGRSLPTRLKTYPPTAKVLGVTTGTLNDEQNIHRKLRPWVAQNREWYHPSAEVMAVVNEFAASYEVPNASPHDEHVWRVVQMRLEGIWKRPRLKR